MYSPRIDDDLIPDLYHLAVRLKKPMTFVVSGVLRVVLKHYDIELRDNHIHIFKKPDLFPGDL